MQIGMIGLGRMGANMARRLMRGGHQVVAYDRSADAVKQLAGEGAKGVDWRKGTPRGGGEAKSGSQPRDAPLTAHVAGAYSPVLQAANVPASLMTPAVLTVIFCPPVLNTTLRG